MIDSSPVSWTLYWLHPILSSKILPLIFFFPMLLFIPPEVSFPGRSWARLAGRHGWAGRRAALQLWNTGYSSSVMEREVGVWLGRRGFIPFSSRCRGNSANRVAVQEGTDKWWRELVWEKVGGTLLPILKFPLMHPVQQSCAQKVVVVTKHTMEAWQRTRLLETDSFFQELHIKKGADSITSKLWLALHTMLPTTVCFQLHKPKCGEKFHSCV